MIMITAIHYPLPLIIALCAPDIEDGIVARKPEASMYVWAALPPGQTSAEFAGRLLEEAGVSVTPGTVFGPSGEGFVRISLGMNTDRIREAMERWQRSLL